MPNNQISYGFNQCSERWMAKTKPKCLQVKFIVPTLIAFALLFVAVLVWFHDLRHFNGNAQRRKNDLKEWERDDEDDGKETLKFYRYSVYGCCDKVSLVVVVVAILRMCVIAAFFRRKKRRYRTCIYNIKIAFDFEPLC